jgi:hypothetical protein
MTSIVCRNCKQTFEWDETRQVAPGGRVVMPGTPGAVRVPAPCTHCWTDNYVWVSHARRDDRPVREESDT